MANVKISGEQLEQLMAGKNVVGTWGRDFASVRVDDILRVSAGAFDSGGSLKWSEQARTKARVSAAREAPDGKGWELTLVKWL